MLTEVHEVFYFLLLVSTCYLSTSVLMKHELYHTMGKSTSTLKDYYHFEVPVSKSTS